MSFALIAILHGLVPPTPEGGYPAEKRVQKKKKGNRRTDTGKKV